ncbi:MAG: hypothetical protein U5R48_16805, partial [Gammaproteobacteria bacterium]|nr:hypothetical protein [Gammaproteobacteria bacterium]
LRSPLRVVGVVFEMDTPTTDNVDAEALREYCVTVDLVSVERLTGRCAGPPDRASPMTLPVRGPGSRVRSRRGAAWPVSAPGTRRPGSTIRCR